MRIIYDPQCIRIFFVLEPEARLCYNKWIKNVFTLWDDSEKMYIRSRSLRLLRILIKPFDGNF